ncbi:WbqC family protein [Lutimonas zeaxanthinifaciens]|uniref:WbqC family protein n=1 Tax=Lutimonas zeaxanthinifaciens TaxID=3060215 RepID=UPI00265D0EFD|nr:WbqC family protein [Lutimonas sp. YSD2104]WKK67308.1 WbqC family protein [Lutimonas sp. YSD2104]
MSILLQPGFFGPIIHYVAMAGDTDIVFEKQDNFQKQTYRNRCYIYGANGRQLLSVPIKHSKNDGRQKTKEIKIDNSFPWQRNFIRSLEASYRSSPFFEFYEDELMNVLGKRYRFLLDLNLEAHNTISECLQLETHIEFTENYETNVEGKKDLRFLVEAKKEKAYDFEPYIQVFSSKYGFLPNLSILDLLFNEGTNALDYLERHKNLLVI